MSRARAWAACFAVLSSFGAPAAISASELGGSIAFGVLSGATQLDSRLADYQWDVATPRASWGFQATWERERFAAGLRSWSARSTQDVGTTEDPEVTVTCWEVVGRHRLATIWGTEVLASASTGLLHLGYRPDRMTLSPGGGEAPIVVALEPVNTWIAGAGIALRRFMPGGWIAGVELEQSRFQLETAHRDGDGIVQERESFHTLNARVELARLWGRW